MGELVRNGVTAAVLLAGLLVLVPIYTSNATYSIVLTASMEPAIDVGDVIAIRPVDPYEVQVGDVIAFVHPDASENTPVIHRVIEIREEPHGLEFQTKGDNLEEQDPWVVQQEHIVGRVAYTIPKIGWAINAVRSGNRALFVAMILVPAGLLVWGEVRNLLRDDDEEADGAGSGGAAGGAAPTATQRFFADLHAKHSALDEDGDETSLVALLAKALAGPALQAEGSGGRAERTIPDDAAPFGEVAEGEGIVVELEVDPAGSKSSAEGARDAPASTRSAADATVVDHALDWLAERLPPAVVAFFADDPPGSGRAPRARHARGAPPPLPAFLEPRLEPRWHVLAVVVGPVVAAWSILTEFAPGVGALAAARAVMPAPLLFALASVHAALPGLLMLVAAGAVAAAATAKWWLVRREPPEYLRRLAERRLGSSP